MLRDLCLHILFTKTLRSKDSNTNYNYVIKLSFEPVIEITLIHTNIQYYFCGTNYASECTCIFKLNLNNLKKK